MSNNSHKEHERAERRRIEKTVKAVKRIDGIEFSMWMGLTVVYVAFVAMLSGLTQVYLPEIVYLGVIPFDPRYGVFILGVTMWIPISLMLQAYFKARRG
jgi:hypothetical protein